MRPLMRHNPAFLSPDELDAGFVVRQSDLVAMVDLVRENTGRPANQHVLVIAARGMGKTTLVLRTANAVRSDPELSASWYPIVWGEEAYQVGTAGEFWLETLLHLGDQTEDPRWANAHAELLDEADEQRLQERALARLMDFADEQRRRLLIVVENLQMILGEQMAQHDKNAGWVLRHTLQNEPRVMLLATSTMRFAQISRRSEALYELFLEHRLDPLTRDECRTLWERVSGEPLSASRARPIEILTGGNTRLLSILASFAAGRTFQELMTELVHLVDEHTDYFKSNFEALSLSERRVFSALADLWQPSMAREVARQARVEVNEASRDLGRLEARGPITVVGEKGRAKLYQLTERLYNLYHLMRRRGNPAQRVRAAVEFIVHLYPEDDVKPVLSKIAREALELESCVRQDHLWAWTGVAQRLAPELRRQVLSEAPSELWRLSDLPKQVWEMASQDEEVMRERFPLVFEFADLLSRSEPDLWLREHQHALRAELERLHDVLPAYALGWAVSAFMYSRLRCFQLAATDLRRLIDLRPDNADAWWMLSQILQELPESLDERVDALRRCLRSKIAAGRAILDLVSCLADERGDLDGAEQLVLGALAESPPIPAAHVALMDLRVRRGDAQGARELLAEAQQEAWNRVELLSRLIFVVIQLGDGQAMLRIGERILELREDNWVGLASVGVAQRALGHTDEAIEAFRRARQFFPQKGVVTCWLGETLLERGDVHEAVDELSAACELEPENAEYVHKLAGAYWQADRFEDAEKAYLDAVRVAPGFALAWFNLGELRLSRLNDSAGARAALERAVAVARDQELPEMVLVLVQLLVESGELREALSISRVTLQRLSGRADLHNNFAWTCAKASSDPEVLSECLSWAARAVELAPANSYYRHTHATLLGRLGRWAESFDSTRAFLADLEWSNENLSNVIDYFIEAAAAGQARPALDLLSASPAAALTEPLIVALQLELGDQPRAPQEIAEVARDVVERIRERRELRRSTPGAGAGHQAGDT